MIARERCIRLLLMLLRNPYRFTTKELMSELEMTEAEIKGDKRAIKAAGLFMDIDRNYKFAILPEEGFTELQRLQSLSEEDIARVKRVLDYLPKDEKLYIGKKLDTLYNFQALGLRALRRPALARIDKIKSAQQQKRRVKLVAYRSNTGTVRDRIVEPYYLDTELDTLQAVDVETNPPRNKHFMLSRIERVELLDEKWSCEDTQDYQLTDVFRIANNKQVFVQLELNLYAYNILIRDYPKAQSVIMPGAEPNTFDFQARVNEKFLGITNFILGNAAHAVIKIIQPEELRIVVKAKAQEIIDKI